MWPDLRQLAERTDSSSSSTLRDSSSTRRSCSSLTSISWASMGASSKLMKSCSWSFSSLEAKPTASSGRTAPLVVMPSTSLS